MPKIGVVLFRVVFLDGVSRMCVSIGHLIICNEMYIYIYATN